MIRGMNSEILLLQRRIRASSEEYRREAVKALASHNITSVNTTMIEELVSLPCQLPINLHKLG